MRSGLWCAYKPIIGVLTAFAMCAGPVSGAITKLACFNSANISLSELFPTKFLTGAFKRDSMFAATSIYG